MQETVVVSACRTPFGAFGGALRDVSAVQLGGVAIRAALQRSEVDPETVDNVIMGMVVAAGAGQVPARQAALAAGLPVSVPAETLNKVCASSLRAVNVADVMIRSGEAEVVVAGGMENMSQGPYILRKGRFGYRLGHDQVVDATVHDGLWCPVVDVHMGNHGNTMAREHGLTREEQDRWALRSHQRAIKAIDDGIFTSEVVPVEVPQRKGEPLPFLTDECPRRDTSLDVLAKIRPAFGRDGTITAGNAPGINDGAAALVLMSRQRAQALGLPILASIVSQGMVSREAHELGTVPALSGRRALGKAGMSWSDMDLIEINEAFAAVTLTSITMERLDEERVNVNGGAIALGHPIGASGGRILTTLIHELRRRGLQHGLATICSGGGQGEATLIRIE